MQTMQNIFFFLHILHVTVKKFENWVCPFVARSSISRICRFLQAKAKQTYPSCLIICLPPSNVIVHRVTGLIVTTLLGEWKKKKNKEEEEEEKKGKSKLGYFRSQICAQFIEWMGCLRIACETVHTFNPFTLRRIVCWRKIDNPYLETIVRGISYECL